MKRYYSLKSFKNVLITLEGVTTFYCHTVYENVVGWRLRKTKLWKVNIVECSKNLIKAQFNFFSSWQDVRVHLEQRSASINSLFFLDILFKCGFWHVNHLIRVIRHNDRGSWWNLTQFIFKEKTKLRVLGARILGFYATFSELFSF